MNAQTALRIFLEENASDVRFVDGILMVATTTARQVSTDSKTATTDFILEFEQVGIQDIPRVGGKNASLGEMIQHLVAKGVRVPTGFATTADAYRTFIQQAGLEGELRSHFQDLDVNDVDALRRCGKRVRSLILDTPFPPELQVAITKAYRNLCAKNNNPVLDVAVRSSVTAED